MVIKDIVAISGQPGLFRFIAQGKNSIIVEHLETGKRSSASGTAKVSSLEDIAMFSETEDVPLKKVFDMVFDFAEGGEAIDPKSDNNALKNWFAGVMPDYSRDRVYPSDIKKVAQWYNILHKLNLLIKEEEESGISSGSESGSENESENKEGKE